MSSLDQVFLKVFRGEELPSSFQEPYSQSVAVSSEEDRTDTESKRTDSCDSETVLPVSLPFNNDETEPQEERRIFMLDSNIKYCDRTRDDLSTDSRKGIEEGPTHHFMERFTRRMEEIRREDTFGQSETNDKGLKIYQQEEADQEETRSYSETEEESVSGRLSGTSFTARLEPEANRNPEDILPVAASIPQEPDTIQMVPKTEKHSDYSETVAEKPAEKEQNQTNEKRESSTESQWESDIPLGSLSKNVQKILRIGYQGIAAASDAVYEAVQAGQWILGFKGILPNAGCSTLLLGVASELAARGLSVLVVDGNFHHPDLAHSLSLTPKSGWEEILFKKAAPKSLMYRIMLGPTRRDSHFPPGTKRSFLLLPLASNTVSRAIVASCKREWMTSIVDLSEHFDLILVDTGSFTANDSEESVVEMLRFGIDGFFLIEDTRKKGYTQVAELIEKSKEHQLSCLGIIENFT